MRPALASAQWLLDSDKGPLLINNMSGRRALVDVLKREGPPTDRDLAPKFPNNMVQPRRG
jgi:hypothetical protein